MSDMEKVTWEVRDYGDGDKETVSVFKCECGRTQRAAHPESIKGDQHLAEWSIINLAVVSSAYERTFAVARKWHYQIEGLLGR